MKNTPFGTAQAPTRDHELSTEPRLAAPILKLPTEIVLEITKLLKAHEAILFALTCKKHFRESHLHHWEVVGRYPPSHTKCAPEHKDCDHPAKRSSEPFWERPLALHWARFFFLKALERDLYPNYYVGTRIPPRTDDDGPDKMEATKLLVFLYPKSFCPPDHEYYALDRQLMELCEFAIEHQLTLAS